MSDGDDDRRDGPEDVRGPAPDEVTAAPDGTDAPPKASGRRRVLRYVLLGVPAALLLLILGTHVVSSDRFCATCHETQSAAMSADRSVHAAVPCIVCHEGGGVSAAITYAPSLLREGVATITGWGVADAILPARDCTSCHTDLSTNPTTSATHPSEATQTCAECHGDVAHPQLHMPGASTLATAEGHPEGFIQTHGGTAIEEPGSCVQCHEQKFCEACHLKETFPHPDGWINRHGAVQRSRGADTCTTCHGASFCAGCHGTEIPHRPDWLGQHDKALQGASTTPCMICHPSTDCSTCHGEHNVHREQDLYVLPST